MSSQANGLKSNLQHLEDQDLLLAGVALPISECGDPDPWEVGAWGSSQDS